MLCVLRRALFVAGVAALALDGVAGMLSVGYSRMDITPGCGTEIPGYFVHRYVKGVRDPLSVVTLAFSDGVRTAVVQQVDTSTLTPAAAEILISRVAKTTGLPREAVFQHASHTHCGGWLELTEDEARMDETAADVTSKLGYARFVAVRATDGAQAAMRDLRPARLSCGRSSAPRISFGRRYHMKDGSVRTNPGVGNPDIVKPAGNPPDEEVQVLRIDREGAKTICVMNFQTHPDVVGGEYVTADWPGLVRTVFEAATGGETLAMVLNGTEGDVNHVNVSPRPGEANGLHSDFDDVHRGYAHSKHMANKIAAAALSVWEKCIPLPDGCIHYGTKTIRIPSNRPLSGEAKDVAWADRVWAVHQAGKDAELPWKGMELTTEVARARRILQLKDGPDAFDLTIHDLAVGKGLAFATYPGEPFNDIGKAVKRQSPFALTLQVCLTGGTRGYFPFSDSYREGGYEAASSVFGPTVADDLIKGQIELLTDLSDDCGIDGGKANEREGF